MSARNILLRQESEDSTSIMSHSPSISSLNRLRDTFRRTESTISSQLSSIVSNAASAASGAVLGTAGATSEASSASASEVSTPNKKRKPGEYNLIYSYYCHHGDHNGDYQFQCIHHNGLKVLEGRLCCVFFFLSFYGGFGMGLLLVNKQVISEMGRLK